MLNKMKKAIFEVVFDPEMMIDPDSLQEVYGGDWLAFMKEMYQEDGLGIFDKELNLVQVVDVEEPVKNDEI